MMMRHLLRAMVLCLALSSLVFAENAAEVGEILSEEVEDPAELSETPLEEGESPQELGEMPPLGGVAATSCRSLSCDVPLTDTIQTPTTRDCFSFSVSQSTLVQISVVETTPSGPNFQPIWRLLTGTGAPASNCGFFTTGSERDCGPLPVSGNPYRVEVEDSGRNDTGTYRVHLQRLTTGATCEDTPLICDVPVTRSIDNPVDSDLLSFSVPQSTLVQISVVETTPSGPNFQPIWRLLTGTGAPASNCGFFTTGSERDCGPLPVSGNPYRVKVEDSGRNDTGTYRVHLQRLTTGATCEDTPLICDVPVTRSIDNPVDSDLLSFSVPQSTLVQISVVETTPSGPNFQPIWRLLTGTGAPASNCGFFTTGSERDCGPLPVSGNPYRVKVEDSGRNDTGTYRVHLQRLTTGATCEDTPLICDVPVTRSIDNPVDSDLLSFSVPQSTLVQISVVETTPSGPNFQPIWRLLTGTGAPASNCGFFTTGSERDCGPLPVSGNPYRVKVEDSGRNDTGTYRVHLQRLTTGATCDNTPIGCSFVTRSIDNPVDSDLLSFSVPQSTLVQISVVETTPSGPNFQPIWRLLTGTGAPASNCGFFTTGSERDCGPLPVSGNPYRVKVEDSGRNDTGTYRARVCPQ